VTMPLPPDERRLPRLRHEPETPEQVEERLRVVAERYARHAKQNAAAYAERVRRAKRARIAEEATAPEEAAG
jgi:hypothetical protein